MARGSVGPYEFLAAWRWDGSGLSRGCKGGHYLFSCAHRYVFTEAKQQTKKSVSINTCVYIHIYIYIYLCNCICLSVFLLMWVTAGSRPSPCQLQSPSYLELPLQLRQGSYSLYGAGFGGSLTLLGALDDGSLGICIH